MRTALLALFCCLLAVPVFAQPSPIPNPPTDELCDVTCQQARANLAAAAAEQSAQPDCMPGPAGDPCRSTPAPSAVPTVTDQLKDLQQRYAALKLNTDKSAKMLLVAGLLAAGLKLLLSGVNLLAGKKPKKWLAWIALFLALPIALLSHYAGGNGVFDSLVYAGAGPGAIVIHELMKLFGKKPAEATA